MGKLRYKKEYKNKISETIIHTGQHFDKNMSEIFFDELSIPRPDLNLSINSSNHGQMTGQMMIKIEEFLIKNKADCVLVYGDTNSTLAGALVASKLKIPVAHVEAGLRSHNMNMPEEINRRLTDHISSFLFCPTISAKSNLINEGISENLFIPGDVMFDISKFYKDKALSSSKIFKHLDLKEKSYALVTCHRAENTDNKKNLEAILTALDEISTHTRVILPLHPRTKKSIENFKLTNLLAKLSVLDPLPFFDMLMLEQKAKVIITDSGGIQKEAFFYDVPCITMRSETEWIETIDTGWNKLTGADTDNILKAFSSLEDGKKNIYPYGDGTASNKILRTLINLL